MAWDGTRLARFRKRHKLSKRELARQLQREGLPTASDRTVARWEGAVTPHPAIQKLLDDALVQIEKRLGK